MRLLGLDCGTRTLAPSSVRYGYVILHAIIPTRYRIAPAGSLPISKHRTIRDPQPGQPERRAPGLRYVDRAAAADQPFLRRAGDQAAGAVEELAAHQAAGAGGRRAVDRVEQPVVEAERAMEPHDVIERCHLQAGRQPAHRVRIERGAEEREVRRVGE